MPTMPHPYRLLAIAALAASAAAVSLAPAAGAQVPQPTLKFDRTCYTDNQKMAFTGAGYTPGGQIGMNFQRPGDVRGTFMTFADAAGGLNDSTGVADPDQLLPKSKNRDTIFVTANDQSRQEAGQQPRESTFGASKFTFTRWGAFGPTRFTPGWRARVRISGWAFAAGKTAWLLFRKGKRTAASVKVGRLGRLCGDKTATVRTPRSLKPGAYRAAFATDRRSLADRHLWRNVRVVAARRAAASAAPRAQRAAPGLGPTLPSGGLQPFRTAG